MDIIIPKTNQDGIYHVSNDTQKTIEHTIQWYVTRERKLLNIVQLDDSVVLKFN